MEYSKSVVGFALYMEQRTATRTQQIIMTPPLYDNESSAVVDAMCISRVIYAEKPQRFWQSRPIVNGAVTADVANKSIRPADSVADAATMMGTTIDLIEQYFASEIEHKWITVGQPIIVEITERDQGDLKINQKPDELIRRIERARKDAPEYPEKMWG